MGDEHGDTVDLLKNTTMAHTHHGTQDFHYQAAAALREGKTLHFLLTAVTPEATHFRLQHSIETRREYEGFKRAIMSVLAEIEEDIEEEDEE